MTVDVTEEGLLPAVDLCTSPAWDHWKSSQTCLSRTSVRDSSSCLAYSVLGDVAVNAGHRDAGVDIL